MNGIAVAQDANKQLIVVAQSRNQNAFFSTQTSPGIWTGWVPLGNGYEGQNPAQIDPPVLPQFFPLPKRATGAGDGQNQDGLIQVFANWPTISPTLLLAQQLPVAGDPWLSWRDAADDVGQVVAVGQNLDGHLEIFTWNNGVVWHLWQPVPNAANLGPIEFLGNAPNNMKQFALGQNIDGRLELFGIDSPGTVFHIWQTVANDSNSWGSQETPWTGLGGGRPMQQIAVGQNADGRLIVFGVTKGNIPSFLFQQTPGGAWNNWSTLGTGHNATSLVVGQNQNGNLEVFDKNNRNAVFHIRQVGQNPATWGTWSEM